MLVTTCWECRTVPPSSSVVDIGVPPPVVQPGSKTEEAEARKGRKDQKRTPFFLCNGTDTRGRQLRARKKGAGSASATSLGTSKMIVKKTSPKKSVLFRFFESFGGGSAFFPDVT